jgi:predicted dehydrogenase
MIRLALSAGESICQEVARRLHGAIVETRLGEGAMTHPPDTCDVVVFLEPRETDLDLVDRCLRSGTHVLLTPPPELSSGELERLDALARQQTAQLAVVNPERYVPSRQLIRQQLDSGALGAPGLVRSHRWEPANATGQSLPSGMRGTAGASGVPLPLMRDLDIAVWLMGRSPDIVYAVEQTANGPDSTPGQSVQVHLGFPGGGMALVDYCDHLPPGDGYQSLSLIGARGAAYADDHQNVQLAYRGGQPRAVCVDELGRRFAALVQEAVDSLAREDCLPAGVNSWRTVLAVTDAVRQSTASRQAVPLEGR